MALYAQYAQRNANTTPHAKSGINRLDIAFIEKTKAENAKIRNEMLNNTFVNKIITPIPMPPTAIKPLLLNYIKVFKILII